MSGNDRNSGFDASRHDNGDSDPSEEELAARLRSLDKRLDTRARARAEAAKGRPDNSGYASALGLSSTFVSAILVGAGMGWAIDRFFGVAPWGMIFFMLLGFAAGTLNVMRSANRISAREADQDADRPD